jgi:hypothetical protein
MKEMTAEKGGNNARAAMRTLLLATVSPGDDRLH